MYGIDRNMMKHFAECHSQRLANTGKRWFPQLMGLPQSTTVAWIIGLRDDQPCGPGFSSNRRSRYLAFVLMTCGDLHRFQGNARHVFTIDLAYGLCQTNRGSASCRERHRSPKWTCT